MNFEKRLKGKDGKFYILTVEYDQFAECPFDDMDMVGKFAVGSYYQNNFSRLESFESGREITEDDIAEFGFVRIPIYTAFGNGGGTIVPEGYGRIVGCVYTEPKRAYDILGNVEKDKIISVMQVELDMYSQWRDGEVLCAQLYEITSPYGDREVVESCGGFYGMTHEEVAKDMMDGCGIEFE